MDSSGMGCATGAHRRGLLCWPHRTRWDDWSPTMAPTLRRGHKSSFTTARSSEDLARTDELIDSDPLLSPPRCSRAPSCFSLLPLCELSPRVG